MCYNPSFDEKAKTWDDHPDVRVRANLLHVEFLKTVPMMPHWAVLELGCGTGSLGMLLSSQIGSLMLSDTSLGMIEVVLQKLQNAPTEGIYPVVADMAEIDTWKPSFHWVYSVLTFHHLPNIEEAWQMLGRWIVPGGYLCVVDLDEEDGSFHGAGFDGHLGFNRAKFKQSAQQHGFKVMSMRTVLQISKPQLDGATREYPAFLLVAVRS